MERAKQVAKILLRIKAVKLSINPSFTFSSGIKSPIYCDNRLIPSYPEEREKIISAWEEVIKENNISDNSASAVFCIDFKVGNAVTKVYSKELTHTIEKLKETFIDYDFTFNVKHVNTLRYE